MKHRFLPGIAVLCLLALFAGCDEKTEGPTRGAVTVYADESLFPVVAASVDSFSRLYPDARVTLTKVNSRAGITKILNGEIKIFVSGRTLNAEETAFKAKNKIEMKTIKYCFDGIAAIPSADIAIKHLSFDSLRLLLAGNLAVKAVIPGLNSGVNEYLRDSLLEGKEIMNAEIAASEEDAVRAVIGGKRKIAFVSWNNVPDDLRDNAIMIGVKSPGGVKHEYYQPHPGYFVQFLYPLTRLCVVYLNEVRLGPASGFATFLAGNAGQKIVLEQQLGPGAVPVKLVY